MTTPGNIIQALRIADAKRSLRHVFVRDLLVTCRIGIYDHEKTKDQRVRLNIDLGVLEDPSLDLGDDYGKVVCYEDIARRARSAAQDGHTNLVETLAERIAQICLQDPRVRSTRVRVEKLDAIEDAFSVGVEIERFSPIEV